MSLNDQKLKKLREAEARQQDAFAALRFRDYRLFTIGRTLLFTSSQMQTVALGWELYDRTGSALVLGGIGLAQVLPAILLTLEEPTNFSGNQFGYVCSITGGCGCIITHLC
jgi:hypothetical protein